MIIANLPEGDAVVNNAILFALSGKAQSMGTLRLKRTFSEKHQQLRQHLEEDQEDTPLGQIQAPDPTTESNKTCSIINFDSIMTKFSLNKNQTYYDSINKFTQK
jgi:hypothetical protein